MSRSIALLCCGCLVAIGATSYGMLASDPAASAVVPEKPPAANEQTELDAAIEAGRRSCELSVMTGVFDRMVERTRQTPDAPQAWHHLAAAALSRLQTRTALRGISVGKPLHDELPAEVAADIDVGLGAVARARALGDDSGDLYRLEAGLMGQRITGFASALQWNGKIQSALAAAVERIPDHAKLHMALGLRKLLSPRFLGHDPAGALEHLQFAMRAMPQDERPALFAAMALHLQDKRELAIAHLEQAVARNPANRFAAVVLQRVRRGEADPFGRDVAAEGDERR